MIARLPVIPDADGLPSSLQHGMRCLVMERNSFATIQELQRRERRISSLLSRGGFWLTSAHSPLQLSRPALEKFKEGLTDALRLTDRLADADGCKAIVEQSSQMACQCLSKTSFVLSWRMEHGVSGGTSSPVPQNHAVRNGLFLAYNKQKAIIETLPTRDLAWLLTLADGAAKGFERYTKRKYKDPDARALANLAFQEMMLRDGSSALWAFVRGDKSEANYVHTRLAQCGSEIVWWEAGGNSARTPSGGRLMPDGLHMTIMQELRRRFLEEAIREWESREQTDDSNDSDSFDCDQFGAGETWTRVNEMIQKEIGAKEWRGYSGLQWPFPVQSVAAHSLST